MSWFRNNKTFEGEMLPHLEAAYTLARWLTANQQDAEDAVQDAYLRALRFWHDCRGHNCRAWLLQIVRNSCYTQMRRNLALSETTSFDEEIHGEEFDPATPEDMAIKSTDSQLVKDALRELPLRYREVLILRELEEMSYLEIAQITAIPLGTVRSSIFRARRLLRERINKRVNARSVQSPATIPKHFQASQSGQIGGDSLRA